MTTAEENRRRMPTVAAFVDEVRKYWPDAKVVYAREGDYEVGKKTEPKGIICGDQWFVDPPRSRGSRK